MTTPLTPFYNPLMSYEDNYNQGPFGIFREKPKEIITRPVDGTFVNLPVNLPFGQPAGPLLNGNYVKAALAYGYDLCVYKTVRTNRHKSHPLPNILSIHVNKKLMPSGEKVLADTNYTFPLSITNSFGVPSLSVDEWQPDLEDAVASARYNQHVIGSFQGTPGNESSIEKDYAIAAKLVAETKTPILEANLSCPNEGVNKLLCFDSDRVQKIAHAIKEAVPDKPLFLKLAYFQDDTQLLDFIKNVGHIVDGFSTINTLSAFPINSAGKPALGEDRISAGVCGDAIRWAGLEMVEKLAKIRMKLNLSYSIIGVGGVNTPEHYIAYRKAGADAVMSATGAMWNPLLAFEIKTFLNN